MNMYYGLRIEDQEEFEATMCPICDTHKKEDGENECKFCWRIGKTVSSFTNMPSNSDKIISMQLLRENDRFIK
jgi:hypothetical protein